MTEGSSTSVSGMGCWNTVPGTRQQLGKANFETSDTYWTALVIPSWLLHITPSTPNTILHVSCNFSS